MRDPHEINAELQAALAAYREIANTAPAPELRAKHEAVKALQTELAETISDGAKPCPRCKAQPLGMLQSTSSGGLQFEVGCTNCGWFLLEGDPEGQARDHGAQGGMPRHAVEAWNAGPRYWKTKAVGKLSAAARESLAVVRLTPKAVAE